MPNARIIKLPPDVIGQIAAGEVVERPSAAIKELVENSMDAGASAITVDIREGGLASLRVVDNGAGIAPSELKMAFERNATSKIARASDLFGVKTLGFRGEALASIAAVARVTCTTRTGGAPFGVTLQNDGGVITDIRQAACPEGTVFLVRDLFYNAPVRRKFLKKPATETGYVSDLMLRFILSRPEISFRFIADDKTVYFSPGDGKLESAVMSVYGLDTLGGLRRVTGNACGVALDGYVGVGPQSRGNRAHQSFILNSRLIKSAVLTSALEDACRQRVMIGRFPLCVLRLTMPFEAADVNVHPNKWEVRFQNEAAVRQALYTLVGEALRGDSPLEGAPPLFPDAAENPAADIRVAATVAPQARSPVAAPLDDTNSKSDSGLSKPLFVITKPAFNNISPVVTKISNASTQKGAPASVGALTARETGMPALSLQTPSPAAPQTMLAIDEGEEAPSLRLLGVLFNTYILLEYQDSMLLCDQHAVHERILFDRMLRACEGNAASQLLLVPQLLRLTHKAYEAFFTHRQTLLQAGFEADDYGDLSLNLRAVPLVLGAAQGGDCLLDALDALAEGGQISQQKRMERILQTACKHAVKGGEEVPRDALFALVRAMLRDNVTPTCPHGRPLVLKVTRRELEKRFGRIQS